MLCCKRHSGEIGGLLWQTLHRISSATIGGPVQPHRSSDWRCGRSCWSLSLAGQQFFQVFLLPFCLKHLFYNFTGGHQVEGRARIVPSVVRRRHHREPLHLDVKTKTIQMEKKAIFNQFLISAAHCVDQFHRKGRAFVVVAGEHDIQTTDSSAEQIFEVENFVTHPNYQSNRN